MVSIEDLRKEGVPEGILGLISPEVLEYAGPTIMNMVGRRVAPRTDFTQKPDTPVRFAKRMAAIAKRNIINQQRGAPLIPTTTYDEYLKAHGTNNDAQREQDNVRIAQNMNQLPEKIEYWQWRMDNPEEAKAEDEASATVRCPFTREGEQLTDESQRDRTMTKADCEEARAKWMAKYHPADQFFGNVVKGITKFVDFGVNKILPIVAPGVGSVIGSVYKNLSGATNKDSEFYNPNSSFGENLLNTGVDILTSKLKGKGRRLKGGVRTFFKAERERAGWVIIEYSEETDSKGKDKFYKIVQKITPTADSVYPTLEMANGIIDAYKRERAFTEDDAGIKLAYEPTFSGAFKRREEIFGKPTQEMGTRLETALPIAPLAGVTSASRMLSGDEPDKPTSFGPTGARRGKGSTHRLNFLKKYKLEDRGYSLKELSKISAVPLPILQEVYDRGIGAYKSNPQSVRLKGSYVKNVDAPMSKKLSKENWAFARTYSFLMGNPKHDNDLRKNKIRGGLSLLVEPDPSKEGFYHIVSDESEGPEKSMARRRIIASGLTLEQVKIMAEDIQKTGRSDRFGKSVSVFVPSDPGIVRSTPQLRYVYPPPVKPGYFPAPPEADRGDTWDATDFAPPPSTPQPPRALPAPPPIGRGRFTPDDYDAMFGSGLFDVIKTGISRIKDVVSTGIRKDYPPSTRRLLAEIGDRPIKKMYIRRDPVKSTYNTVINLISLGKWNQLRQKYGYDKVFHLGLEFVLDASNTNALESRYVIEKNATIDLAKAKPFAEDTQIMEVPYSGGQTLNAMLAKAQRSMKGDFFTYSAFTNNCQDFILALLISSGLATNEAIKFIKQNMVEVATQLPGYLKKVAQFATDAGAVASVALEGRGGMKARPKFAKQLAKFGISQEAYLDAVRQKAKAHGLAHKYLGFSDDDKHKLQIANADGKIIRFGAVGLGDFVLYSLSHSPTAEKSRKSYLARATKIPGDWKKDSYSPNSLAIAVLW
jgi:hypothetical protein